MRPRFTPPQPHEEPKHINCYGCETEIYVGDEFFDINEDKYCEECAWILFNDYHKMELEEEDIW